MLALILMKKPDDPSSISSSELDALIKRLESGQSNPKDHQLLIRILKLFLSFSSLLQSKTASLSHL
jgi:hypothetical protein